MTEDAETELNLAPPPPAPPVPGSLLSFAIPRETLLAGRYLVGDKLGEGAVATVYTAVDRHLGQVVALKVLDPLRAADPVGRARFDRELEVLSRIDHPGVARAFGLARDGELELLVLEHLEGPTLRARLDRGRLPVNEAGVIASRLADALAACHAQGVLHRDLKPENVILHPERGPVILDFGLAWFTAAATLTRTGAVIGSPQYLAPELMGSAIADERADLYALSAMLFEMLVGRPVYEGETIDVLALAQAGTTPPSAFNLRPELGTRLSAIVDRGISPRPECRYATAFELGEVLRGTIFPEVRTLDARLACPACRTARLVELEFCPGCGAPANWRLTPGPYAVEVNNLRDVDSGVAWLRRRHASALVPRTEAVLTRRLQLQPIPLAIGVSEESAHQLAAEARELGAEASVIHTRRLGGPRLHATAASPLEVAVTLGLHFAATVVLGAALVLGLGFDFVRVCGLPPLVAVLGIGVAVVYLRRPLLRPRGGWSPTEASTDGRQIRGILHGLKHERTRHLAAQLISRAAPLLLAEASTIPLALREDLQAELQDGLGAVARADAHLDLIARHPRSRLAADLDTQRARAARGDGDARDRCLELEALKTELTEASLAHDAEVRAALEACAEISRTLAAAR